MNTWVREEGSPFPLGLSWVEREQSYNFALYSKHAESVCLLLYGETDLVNPLIARPLDYLHHRSGRVWHARLPKSSTNNARYYAYRIDGPASQGNYEWHVFDPAKIVLDPYAKALFFPSSFSRQAAIDPGPNSGRAALGELVQSRPPLPSRLSVKHESDLVIYELHVRGFSQNPNSGVSSGIRGTFAGVIEKIPYLQDLGITAVELMPVFQNDPEGGDYWGYMPFGFFAPNQRYAGNPNTVECRGAFCSMVDALHAAGIEVILDVVFNHTAEGDQGGPKYHLKLIDNSTYYMVSPVTGDYLDFSGTGNSLHCANRAVRRMILDSMRDWVNEMGVDGFRFDLASIFSLNSDGSVNFEDPPIFDQISGDPDFAGILLIAEPWDAAGVDQLGRNFPGVTWRQWNGTFRDTLRKFVKGDPGMVGETMSCLYGSCDLFPDALMTTYHPYQSVNYVASHDGFTLYDLVSYNEKHNEANGQNNTDGPREDSWNCGWEGDIGVPSGVMKLRKQQIRNFICLLMSSNGTPMFRMGDEFGQTQSGNNNPYNQDNETSWLDWNRGRAHPDLYRFVREMIAFRKAHPSLSRSRFWRNDVQWYGTGSAVDLSFDSRSFAFCLHGASVPDQDMYLMANAFWEDLDFEIQEAGPWSLVVNTSEESPKDILSPGSRIPLGSTGNITVRARSVVLLIKG
ncbi:MAG: glycogen debranching protein [Leptospirales bacterium]